MLCWLNCIILCLFFICSFWVVLVLVLCFWILDWLDWWRCRLGCCCCWVSVLGVFWFFFLVLGWFVIVNWSGLCFGFRLLSKCCCVVCCCWGLRFWFCCWIIFLYCFRFWCVCWYSVWILVFWCWSWVCGLWYSCVFCSGWLCCCWCLWCWCRLGFGSLWLGFGWFLNISGCWFLFCCWFWSVGWLVGLLCGCCGWLFRWSCCCCVRYWFWWLLVVFCDSVCCFCVWWLCFWLVWIFCCCWFGRFFWWLWDIFGRIFSRVLSWGWLRLRLWVWCFWCRFNIVGCCLGCVGCCSLVMMWLFCFWYWLVRWSCLDRVGDIFGGWIRVWRLVGICFCFFGLFCICGGICCLGCWWLILGWFWFLLCLVLFVRCLRLFFLCFFRMWFWSYGIVGRCCCVWLWLCWLLMLFWFGSCCLGFWNLIFLYWFGWLVVWIWFYGCWCRWVFVVGVCSSVLLCWISCWWCCVDVLGWRFLCFFSRWFGGRNGWWYRWNSFIVVFLRWLFVFCWLWFFGVVVICGCKVGCCWVGRVVLFLVWNVFWVCFL